MKSPAPLPTPFDITDIPYFAWVPGPAVWSGAFVIIASLAAVLFFIARPRHPNRKRGKLLAGLLEDLKRVEASSDPAQAPHALYLTKRIAALLFEPNCSQLSARELRMRAAARPVVQSHAALCLGLADLEELLYQATSAQRDQRALELVRAVAKAVREISIEERRDSKGIKEDPQ